MNPSGKRYTCNEYREEMILLGLVRKLEDPALSEAERNQIQEQIRDLERRMGMT